MGAKTTVICGAQTRTQPKPLNTPHGCVVVENGPQILIVCDTA